MKTANSLNLQVEPLSSFKHSILNQQVSLLPIMQCSIMLSPSWFWALLGRLKGGLIFGGGIININVLPRFKIVVLVFLASLSTKQYLKETTFSQKIGVKHPYLIKHFLITKVYRHDTHKETRHMEITNRIRWRHEESKQRRRLFV